MKKLLTTAITTGTTLILMASAHAQVTGWERPITSKLEALQPGIIALGVAIALIAFLVGIIKALTGRGGFESWKLPITAIVVGILIAIAPHHLYHPHECDKLT